MTVLDQLPALASPDSLLGRPTLSGVRALLMAVEAGHGTPASVSDHLAAAPRSGTVPVLLLDEAPDPGTLDHLRRHLTRGGHAVVAVSTEAAPALARIVPLEPGSAAVARPRAEDPLVLDPHLVGHGTGPLVDLRLEADDLVPLSGEGALPAPMTPTMVADGRAVVVVTAVGAGTLVIVGSIGAWTNRWIAAADNAVVLAWAICGVPDRSVAGAVADHLPRPTAGREPHAPVPTIDNRGDAAIAALLPDADVAIGSPAFLGAAARAGRLLSAEVHDALCDFADAATPAGALLIRGMPLGAVPATPASPLETTTKDHLSELALLTVARRLGQPIGYEPEHGGDIVQNLLPTRGDVARQTSTSSGVELEFHTETAFHPHKPRFLLLLCLRGDPAAETLLCSISEVVGRLPLGVQQVLREPRFRTGVDESFTGTRSERLGRPMAVLGGTEEAPTFTFDADLMTGLDPEASGALEALRVVIGQEHIGMALEAGDLLVVDNRVSVHGRSPFTARFDGTDRWLQRTFVVTDLAASARDRRGRVITTRFA